MATDDIVLVVGCVAFGLTLFFWLGYLRGRHDAQKQMDRNSAVMGMGSRDQPWR